MGSDFLRPLAILLVCLAGSLAGADPDPRPVLVVIGENGTAPFGSGPAWTDLLQSRRPGWRILADANGSRDLDGAVQAVPGILSRVPRADMVALMIGTTDAEAVRAASTASIATRYRNLIRAVRTHPMASRATIVAVTPVPVVDARLDQWSRERFAGGQARSAAIAAAVREAAAAEGAAMLDLHAWALADEDNGKPGRILGSIGWIPREWGHPIIAAWIEPGLAKLLPAPADPAALARWEMVQAAEADLDRILSTTGEGRPDLGEPLPTTLDKGRLQIRVPGNLLAGEHLALAIQAPAEAGTAISLGGDKPRPTLAWTGGSSEPPPWSWTMIDEATPTATVDRNRFKLNQGKMRFHPMARDGAGVRRWILWRIPLGAAAGASEATVSATVVGTLDNADAALGGTPVVRPVLGRDGDFDPITATWTARDGRGLPWTGGTPGPMRKAAVTQFLATHPPEPVAARARAAAR
ncbi:MAG: hypothetical protein RLY86_4466 [Pseudomonadota bacterium]|jgi:hypothetical protein